MSPVVQHFTLEIPDEGTMEEPAATVTVRVTRESAEALFTDLGVSLYGENFQTRQGAAHVASEDLAALVETIRQANQGPFMAEHPDTSQGHTVSTEELAAQKQAMAAVEEQARAQVRADHTAPPNQPHGSAIGVRHLA